MKFNVAVLTILAATLSTAPLLVSAADSTGAATSAPAPAKAKHHHKKGKKSAPAAASTTAPK